jgi:drug/metabolite transporter (DMT)-like permease
MTTLLIVLALIGIVLLILGGVIQAVQFLLWIGLVLLILAAIAFLLRVITGRRV